MQARVPAPGDAVDAGAGSDPVVPLPAATLVLIRDGHGGREEVLLLRRPLTSAFAPDTWVFPGGRLDPSDLAFDHRARTDGPDPERWGATLGIADPLEAAAYPVAALRETFEETGILLTAEKGAEVGSDGLSRGRRELLRDGSGFEALLARWHVRLATADLHYLGHWITPERLHRRFDTRFFATRVPRSSLCTLEGDELVDFRWLRPAVALRAASRGTIQLLPPTIHTLRSLDATRPTP